MDRFIICPPYWKVKSTIDWVMYQDESYLLQANNRQGKENGVKINSANTSMRKKDPC